MSDSKRPQATVVAPAKTDETAVASSRRLLFATGIAGALGLAGALTDVGVANAATSPKTPPKPQPTPTGSATPPQPTTTKPAPKSSKSTSSGSSKGTALSTTTDITLKPRVRAIAKRPYAKGGPVDRDASMAMTVQTGAAAVTTGKQYTTFSAAAAASTPLASTMFTPSDHHGHLLRRATFGARPSDVANLKKLGINGWLAAQLAPTKLKDTNGDAAWAAFPLAGASASKILKDTAMYSWDAMLATAQATLGRQIFSNRQLYEIVVDIFSAHLHVAIPGEQWHMAPDYIKNVIRAHAFGKYRTMLVAAMKHPAMLDFLNNDQSEKAHVNENLGRELLELHTVGLIYTEDDVLASASILSGRTIDYSTGSYVWDPDEHVIGPQTVLGFTTANSTAAGGEAVGDKYLDYLSTHRSTALMIARKIATRFVSDEPSDDLLNRLADVYLAKDTSILETVKAVFLSSDFWSAVGIRMRRPLEDAVGAARVLSVTRGTTAANTASGITNLYWSLWNAGNNPLGWDPPNGYPDVAAAWLGAGSMIQRWNLHRGLVYGWSGPLTFIAPLKLVPLTSKTTFGEWVDAVALRLIGNPLTAAHRAAVLAGIGHADTDVVPTWNWTWNGAGEGISLILDSAYFQLR